MQKFKALWNRLTIWRQKLIIFTVGLILSFFFGWLFGLINDNLGGVVFTILAFFSVVGAFELQEKPN